MRSIILYIMTTVITIFMTACDSNKSGSPQPNKETDTVPMLVTQVQKCSKLYTAEYKVHKIITHEDKITMKGEFLQHAYDISLPLGSRKVAIPMEATVKAYIDFSDFSEKNVNRTKNHIEIILPDPRVEMTATKISHAEIKKYVAFMRQDFSDKELANYEQQGREAIIKDIPRMGITEAAQKSAAKIIVPLLTRLGYREDQITVTFRKDFTAADILKMVDPTTEIEGK